MNGIIKSRGISRPEYVFFSDLFADNLEASDAALSETIKGIIAENSATMFTWYDGMEKMRIIVYNFDTFRAGYFCNGEPTSHHDNIDIAVNDVVMQTMENDVYIKAI